MICKLLIMHRLFVLTNSRYIADLHVAISLTVKFSENRIIERIHFYKCHEYAMLFLTGFISFLILDLGIFLFCKENASPLCIFLFLNVIEFKVLVQVHYHITDGSENRTNMQPGQMSFMVNQVIFKSPLFGKSSFEQLRVKSEDMEKVEGQDINMFGQMIKRLTGEGLNLEIAHPPRLLGLGLQLNCVEDVRQNNILSIEARKVDDACTASNMEVVSCEKNNEVREKEQLFDLNSIPPPETAVIDEPADCEFMHGAAVISDDKKASLGRESNTMLVKNRVGMPTTEISHANKNSLKCAAKRKLFGNDGLDTKLQANSNYAGHLKAFGTLKEKQQCKGDQVSVSTIRRTKQKLNDLATNERVGNSTSVSSKVSSKKII